MYFLRYTALAIACISFSSYPSVNVVALSSKANSWAQTIITNGGKEDAVMFAQCAYFSYEAVQIDSIVRMYMNNLIALSYNLRAAIVRYEPYEQIEADLNTTLKQLVELTNYRTQLIEQWQAMIAQCEGTTHPKLKTAFEQMHDYATSIATNWQKLPAKPLDTLAQATNRTVGEVMMKMKEIAAYCQMIGEGKKVPALPEEQKQPQEIITINRFDMSCQELAACGFVLIQVANEAIGTVAHALQEGPAQVFLTHYTALFNAYKKKYGAEEAKKMQLPDPEELWEQVQKNK